MDFKPFVYDIDRRFQAVRDPDYLFSLMKATLAGKLHTGRMGDH